ncbi:alpha/beta hydrolase [Streptomyces sp. NPDC046203]|uniref:alpha/beta fold hydrolase n=1 Tax=Streptomyces sp. NPDC046203 TaxID=3154602 RepID=UPI0033C178B1
MTTTAKITTDSTASTDATPAPPTAVRSGTLQVPGATLYYEVRGSGPVLLLIPGGAGDAGLYEGMAGLLVAAGYTVVSYDQRGLSRSPLDAPEPAGQRVEVWREDARAVLDAVLPAGERAYVFGCSSGAIVALALLAAHPGRLHRVVAHEPPLVELLADPAPYRTRFAETRELLRTRGIGPAMARFTGQPEREEPGTRDSAAPELELPDSIRQMASRMTANMPVFLEHVLCSFSSSTPDLDGLRAAVGQLVLAVGEESDGQEELVGPARRLAELTGAPQAVFPGGHVGCVQRPEECAERLIGILRA